MEYLRKALELEPDNLDARLQMITSITEHHLDEQRLCRELLALAEQQMKEAGAFKEHTVNSGQRRKTRPYMRVRYTYFDVLISCGTDASAISEGQQLLGKRRPLVSYQLINCTSLWRTKCAWRLKQFDSYEETQMLLPLAVLYYKLNQFDEGVEDYIKRLSQKANKDTKKFLRASSAHDELTIISDELNPSWYQNIYDGRNCWTNR